MKKTMMMIVNATMAVTMVLAGIVARKTIDNIDNKSDGTASVTYAEATTQRDDYSIASVVTEAKRISNNPAVTHMGPITIDGESWRYTAKTVNGRIEVTVYQWDGIGTLFGELSAIE